MSIGQELLDVPFPEMVFKLANAIAMGQRRLDRASLDTAKALAKAKVQVIPEIFELIEPGTVKDVGGVPVTGVKVTSTAGDPAKYTLLQAGLTPTFYQFTESLIEVKISISQRTEVSSELEMGAEFETSVETEAEAHAGFFLFGGSAKVKTSSTFSSHVNYTSAAKYSYQAEGSSLLRTPLKPVPPPARLIPRIVTVNALKQPPEVTIT
ncbi:MAG: hypothetical protein FJW96_14195 [Actinobacteria bacterium]|nr:hypothetical protein [Actinomycetota bacterium]